MNVEILDLPSLTSPAMLVVLYDALLQSNENTETSYHLTGSIDVRYQPAPLDLWASAGGAMPAPLDAALQAGEHFASSTPMTRVAAKYRASTFTWRSSPAA